MAQLIHLLHCIVLSYPHRLKINEAPRESAVEKQEKAPSPSLFSRFSFAVSGGRPEPEEREWTYTNELNERQLDEMWTRKDALSFLDTTYGVFNIVKKGLDAFCTGDGTANPASEAKRTKQEEEHDAKGTSTSSSAYAGSIPFRVLFDFVIFLLRHSEWKLEQKEALELWAATVTKAPSAACKDVALSWWGGYAIHLDTKGEDEDEKGSEQQATKDKETFMRQVAAVPVWPYENAAQGYVRDDNVRYGFGRWMGRREGGREGGSEGGREGGRKRARERESIS